MEEINKFLLRINPMRHGTAKYGQMEVPFEEANDLTEQGIHEAEENAKKLAELIGSEEEVVIWSSPIGRTQQTAKIVANTFANKGIHIRRKGHEKTEGIRVFKELGEVKNFSWALFIPLVEGGEVTYGGKTFFVPKELTNPENLSPMHYFSLDAAHRLSRKAKKALPREYVQAVEKFERSREVVGRLMKMFVRIEKLEDKPYRIVMVTHDGLIGFLAKVFTDGKETGVKPADFVTVERKEGKLVVTQVGETRTGNSTTDVVDAFDSEKN